MLIEDKASGAQLIQELIVGRLRCRYERQAGMRQDYAAARADRVNREWLRLSPGNRPWLAEYLHEMMVFPKGKHDDQVDRPRNFSIGSKRLWWAGHWRRRSEARNRNPRNVRFQI